MTAQLDAAAPGPAVPTGGEHRPEIVTLDNLRKVSRNRVLGLGIAAAIFGLATMWIFGFNTPSHLKTTIDFNWESAVSIPKLTVPVALTAIIFGLVQLALAGFLIWRRPAKGSYGVFFVGLTLFLVSFLIWIARGSATGAVPALAFTEILWAIFISSTPLIYGSLSGVLCERAGVVNIAVEGQFLVGAITAAMLSSLVGDNTLGFVSGTVGAAVIGAVFGALLAFMALHYKADQVIIGVLIVAFCTGLTTFLTASVLSPYQNLNQGFGMQPIAIPLLSKIPIIGPVVFDQKALVYLAIVLVALANVGLFRTRWGLRVRSVGEKPRAAETVGLSVTRIRHGNVILGGAVAGIGGAFFTIGQGIQFNVGMTNGLGFIALAIMIFGRWRPWGAFAATMLFGFTISLNSQLNLYGSQVGVPSELIAALPYIVTIAVVAGLIGRVRAPAADGVPYSRE